MDTFIFEVVVNLLMEGRSPCRQTFSLNYVAVVNRTAKMLSSHGASDEVSSFYDVRLCSFWSWLFDRFILRQVFLSLRPI